MWSKVLDFDGGGGGAPNWELSFGVPPWCVLAPCCCGKAMHPTHRLAPGPAVPLHARACATHVPGATVTATGPDRPLAIAQERH